MTKLSILFVSLLLITASVQAQNYFGIKGGIAFTSMSGGHLGIAYEDRGEIGGTTGLTAEFVINDYFSLAPELIFSRKGTEIYKGESNITIATRTDIYHFGYMEIPLLAKIGYDLDFMEVFVKTGPYLGFILGGMASEEGTGIIGKRELSLDQYFSDTERNQEFTKFDMGWYLGGGAAIYAGPGKVFLGLHYDIGFMEIAQDNPTYTYKSMGANRAFIIEAGYLYEF